MPNTVSISTEKLRDLMIAAYTLRMLENGGVDNWCGYSESRNGEYSGEMSVSEYEDRVSQMTGDELVRSMRKALA